MKWCLKKWNINNNKNIAKGTTDPRVEFISRVQTQILIKFHLENLDQASTSNSQPNMSLSIKLKVQNPYHTYLNNLDQDSTLIQHYLYKTSAEKTDQTPASNLAWASTSNLDQTLCSKSEQKFSFLTKPQVSNLQQIVANTIIISNSYSINKFWVDIFTRQGHTNKVY